MKTILSSFSLSIALLTSFFATAQCPTNLNFSSQSDIDNFATNYPGCTQITGNLIIQGNNITSIDGLNGLTHIGGYLQIIGTTNLTHIDGLESLVSVGNYIDIYLNSGLTDISGLGNLVFDPSFWSLIIESNFALSICSVPNLCRYLADTNNASYITGNATGCGSTQQIRSACIAPDANGILYVRKGSLGNGTSWTDALGEVSDAFAEAQTDMAITQIWVAKGTYSATGTGLRMRNNLQIYGGFDPDNGIVELTDKRISPTQTTGSILTGNNARRVITNIFTNPSRLNDTAVLDGFTITQGNPPHTTQQLDIADSGGGIINVYASPKLVNLFIIDNYANDRGGGIYNSNSSPVIVNTVVARNSAHYSGGGIYNLSSPAKIINSTVAYNQSERVGGIRNNGTTSQLVLKNTIVYGNIKTITNDPEDKNLSNIANGSSTLTNSFVQNVTVADAQGNIPGTIDPLFVNVSSNNFRLLQCSPLLDAGSNTVFAPSQVPDVSAIVSDLDGNPRIQNTVVDLGAYENTAPIITTLYVDATATGTNDGTSWNNAYTSFAEAVVVAHKCTDVNQIRVAEGTYYPEYAINFMSNSPSINSRHRSFSFHRSGLEVLGGYPNGGGERNWDLHPTILSGNIGNPSLIDDNAYHVVVTSNSANATLILNGFTITKGNANQGSSLLGVFNDSGGGWSNFYGSPTLNNIIFKENYAIYGGACYIQGGNPSTNNAVMSGNIGVYGGGCYIRSGNPAFTNVTISGNHATVHGGGFRRLQGSPTLHNSIIYGNTSPLNPGIHHNDGLPTLSYCLVQDLSSTANGNMDGIANNPQFIAPVTTTTPTSAGNYRLQANSPVIDAANSTLIPATITNDLDGNNRIMGLSADMGAYEYQGARCPYITTWNGMAWSNGLPNQDTKIVFDGDYISDNSNSDSGKLQGCSVEVISGDVIISDGHGVIINHEINIAGGSFALKNNASLVQVEDAALNKGEITSERITPPIYRYDYVYWSSPVTEDSNFMLGKNPSNLELHGLSPDTLFDKFFYWNTNLQEWSIIPYGNEAMVPGKGYIVRAPQSHGSDPLDPASYNPFAANFIGKPNNGLVNIPIAGGENQWNLIGNPYPSALFIDKFLYENNPIVDGTIYIWTHSTAISNGGSGSEYSYDIGDYATYNLSGAVGTGSGDGAPNGGNIPTGYIASGQSFFIKGSAVGGTAICNNSMRVDEHNDQFFRPTVQNSSFENAPEKHRIWLNLTGTQNVFKQMMVGYIQNATNDLDWGYDGETFSTHSFSLYSIMDDKTLSIQGRALPFDDTDVVPLGYKSAIAGTLNISIDHVDGLFNEQDIYLEDTVLDTLHNLKDSDYTFTTAAGTFNERFVLRYVTSNLDDDHFENASQQVLVAKIENELVVKSLLEPLREVSVYDILGRRILHKTNIQNNEIRMTDVVMGQQTLIVKTALENGVVTTQKVIY